MSGQEEDCDADAATTVPGGRRQFLKRGVAAGIAGTLPSALANSPRDGLEPWQKQPGAPFSRYGQPAAAENDVVRWPTANPATPGTGVSWSPLHQLDGTITPNGLHFERHHNGVPQIEVSQHRLRVFGQVEQATEFSVDDLLRYPRKSRHLFIECGGNSNAAWRSKPVQAAAGHLHGLVSCSEWTGVPLSYLISQTRPMASASWLIAGGADAFSHTMSLPLSKGLDDCLLALFQNGERLRPEQGYPLRLIVPGWEGVLNVKWLTSLEISEQPAMTRNETAKYTELLPDGSSRMFTFVMAPKSVVTWPSPASQLAGPGWYEISGLAWSGSGAVKTVEISTDGGKSWATASLDEPVLAKSWTRFRMAWEWNGEAAVVQSRVTDEAGNTQPTRAALLAERGSAAYYHYNAIISWGISPDGSVEHTYVDSVAVETDLDTLFLEQKWD